VGVVQWESAQDSQFSPHNFYPLLVLKNAGSFHSMKEREMISNLWNIKRGKVLLPGKTPLLFKFSFLFDLEVLIS
jgi:hypothetical protein